MSFDHKHHADMNWFDPIPPDTEILYVGIGCADWGVDGKRFQAFPAFIEQAINDGKKVFLMLADPAYFDEIHPNGGYAKSALKRYLDAHPKYQNLVKIDTNFDLNRLTRTFLEAFISHSTKQVIWLNLSDHPNQDNILKFQQEMQDEPNFHLLNYKTIPIPVYFDWDHDVFYTDGTSTKMISLNRNKLPNKAELPRKTGLAFFETKEQYKYPESEKDTEKTLIEQFKKIDFKNDNEEIKKNIVSWLDASIVFMDRNRIMLNLTREEFDGLVQNKRTEQAAVLELAKKEAIALRKYISCFNGEVHSDLPKLMIEIAQKLQEAMNPLFKKHCPKVLYLQTSELIENLNAKYQKKSEVKHHGFNDSRFRHF